MSLYGKLSRMGRKFNMYKEMLAKTEGTYAASCVKNEIDALSNKFMVTLNDFYMDNGLFREFIDSEDGSFLMKKYVELFPEKKPSKDIPEDNARIGDFFGITGIFTNIGKRVVELDAMKHTYRLTLESYQNPQTND